MARHAAHTDIPTLLLGDWYGKSFYSCYSQFQHPREKAFVALHQRIPADLLESELFGYTKVHSLVLSETSEGLSKICTEGTPLSGRNQEMPMALQAKMLRVLKPAIRAVGLTDVLMWTFRVIAATNVNPQEEIKRRASRGP